MSPIFAPHDAATSSPVGVCSVSITACRITTVLFEHRGIIYSSRLATTSPGPSVVTA